MICYMARRGRRLGVDVLCERTGISRPSVSGRRASLSGRAHRLRAHIHHHAQRRAPALTSWYPCPARVFPLCIVVVLTSQTVAAPAATVFSQMP
jgi:hypothetical protein